VRSWWLYVATGTFALTVIASGSGASEQSQPQFTAAVNYVELPVRVVDRQGRFVTGLKTADFSVAEDAVNQPLTAAEEVHLTGREARQSQASRVGDTPQVEQGPPRVYVVLVDDYHLSREVSSITAAALKTFIQEQIRPTDLIGVVFTSGARGQDVTADHDLALAVVPALHGQFDAHEPPVAKEQRAATVLMTIVSIGRALASDTDRGSTTLVLVTSGVGCVASPRASDIAVLRCGSRLSDAIEAARGSGVTIDAIDPAGLANPHWAEPSEMRNGQGQLTLSGAARPTGSDNIFDATRVLADDTGGFVVANGEPLMKAFERVTRESGSFYRLGYYSTHDGEPGKIGTNLVVRVSKSGVSLTYQTRRSPRARPR
jgi:VWFA-related protein